MSQLAEDLKAARALIDTQEKYEALGVTLAIRNCSSGIGVSNMFKAVDAARKGKRKTHADIMALFDRAIAKAEGETK